MTTTPSKTTRKMVGKKIIREIRTFLWDNPELRKAYRQASERSKKDRKQPN